MIGFVRLFSVPVASNWGVASHDACASGACPIVFSLRAIVPWHLNRSPVNSFALEAKSVGTGDTASCHLSEGLPLLL